MRKRDTNGTTTGSNCWRRQLDFPTSLLTTLLIGVFVIASMEFVCCDGRIRHAPAWLSESAGSATFHRCHKCPPGYGVTRTCSPHSNTHCEPCTRGSSYSQHHSYRLACQTCSKCGTGLYEAHPCTTVSDTICDSCSTVKGPHNSDFQRRCRKTRTPAQSGR